MNKYFLEVFQYSSKDNKAKEIIKYVYDNYSNALVYEDKLTEIVAKIKNKCKELESQEEYKRTKPITVDSHMPYNLLANVFIEYRPILRIIATIVKKDYTEEMDMFQEGEENEKS